MIKKKSTKKSQNEEKEIEWELINIFENWQ
jgi:hypothetical protein